MKNKSYKKIFVEYLLCDKLLFETANLLSPYYFSKYNMTEVYARLEPIAKSLIDTIKRMSIDQIKFEKLLNARIDALATKKTPKKSLENFIESYQRQIEEQIHKIPNTEKKAQDYLLALIGVEAYKDIDQIYDAMVLLHDEITTADISKVVRYWKEEENRTKEDRVRLSENSFFANDLFWISRDFMETLDGISRYRFREYFEIGEFNGAFESVESMFGSSILDGFIGQESYLIGFWGDHKLTSSAYDLWLVSRSRNLPNKIKDFVNIALYRIAGWQNPEGYWPDFQLVEKVGKNKTKILPSTYTTALCALDLLKLSTAEPLKQKGILGAKWLLKQQNPDGSWSREEIQNNKITSNPDLFVSLLSLEVLARSGIRNVKHTIELGLEWLINKQNNMAMWDYDGFPFPFMTILVLEFLKSKGYFSKKLDQYMSMSKGFLKKSLELSLQENQNSHRLAIIAAFHGIEAFLYSILCHPNVNIKIFENPDKTIGMKKALIKFQNYLQDKSIIKRNEAISYRNSLDRLAYLRDEIVHKCIDITQSTCRPLIDDAFKFLTKYSLEIFGFDIFI
jgi:hypothetical protein